jgi:uncharacterized membrane protein YcgQ (UPF0703/DUF1980 family)
MLREHATMLHDTYIRVLLNFPSQFLHVIIFTKLPCQVSLLTYDYFYYALYFLHIIFIFIKPPCQVSLHVTTFNHLLNLLYLFIIYFLFLFNNTQNNRMPKDCIVATAEQSVLSLRLVGGTHTVFVNHSS